MSLKGGRERERGKKEKKKEKRKKKKQILKGQLISFSNCDFPQE
jgi:hypothetical protein